MLKLLALGFVIAPSLLAESHQLDLTTGYNYQNSDQGHGARANLHGWFADLEFDLTEHVAITGEVDNYYGHSQGESVRQQNFVVGPQFTFRAEDARIRPFLYAQSGDQRSSSAGNITHSLISSSAEALSSSCKPAFISRSRPQSITSRSYRVQQHTAME